MNFTYDFVPASPAVPNMSCRNLDVLWNEKQVAVQLLFCGFLLLSFIENHTQRLCAAFPRSYLLKFRYF